MIASEFNNSKIKSYHFNEMGAIINKKIATARKWYKDEIEIKLKSVNELLLQAELMYSDTKDIAYRHDINVFAGEIMMLEKKLETVKLKEQEIFFNTTFSKEDYLTIQIKSRGIFATYICNKIVKEVKNFYSGKRVICGRVLYWYIVNNLTQDHTILDDSGNTINIKKFFRDYKDDKLTIFLLECYLDFFIERASAY